MFDKNLIWNKAKIIQTIRPIKIPFTNLGLVILNRKSPTNIAIPKIIISTLIFQLFANVQYKKRRAVDKRYRFGLLLS